MRESLYNAQELFRILRAITIKEKLRKPSMRRFYVHVQVHTYIHMYMHTYVDYIHVYMCVHNSVNICVHFHIEARIGCHLSSIAQAIYFCIEAFPLI